MLKNEYSLTEKDLSESSFRHTFGDIQGSGGAERDRVGENLWCEPNAGAGGHPASWRWRALVDTIPNRGAYVHNIHGKDVKDVYASFTSGGPGGPVGR